MAFEKTHLLRFRKTNTAKKKNKYCEEKTHLLRREKPKNTRPCKMFFL